jgi:hypothetical protein
VEEGVVDDLGPWDPAGPAGTQGHILSPQGSEVNLIGIGTSLVTCPQQPSLGCVYKVRIASGPRWDRSGRSWVVGDRGPAIPTPSPCSWYLWEASLE